MVLIPHRCPAAAVAYIFVAQWKQVEVFFIIGITHLAIDLWKSQQKDRLKYFLIDQFLHLLVLVIVTFYLLQPVSVFRAISQFLENTDIWLVSMGYAVVIWPFGYIIAYATKRWKKEIDDEGLYDAGKTIGQLERILILTFVLSGRYDAIGFLIAAKSVFRFSQIQQNSERKIGEYILIGTLLSFVLSIGVGLLVKWLMDVM